MAETPFAIIGIFDSARELLDAVPQVRDKRLGTLEAYTPYAVHGLDEALGQKPSRLGLWVMLMGLLGAAVAMAFQWWASAVDYPIGVGGKALFSWQAFVPIMFEMTVLFATFTAGMGMLFLLNRLPFFGHPVLQHPVIAAITRDKFALAIEAGNGAFDAEAAKAALAEAGAKSIEAIGRPGPYAPWQARTWLGIGLGIAAACVASGALTYAGARLLPILPPMVHMEDQPKLNAFKPDAFFKDGRGMQEPVQGTVAREETPFPFKSPEEAAGLANPLPVTKPVMEKGRAVYNAHCAVCHGPVGDGVPLLSSAYGAKPANLQSKAIRDYTDGQIYGVIMLGKNAMPSYAADLTPDERWEAVAYLRALQRAQNARDEDIP